MNKQIVPGRISVIVPLYNYEQYVAECLESALGQNYPDVEIIVVDDGSTDGGPAIVEGYADRGVRLIRQSRCGYGCARALNRGIAESTGEYVAWLSADDRLPPGRLERHSTILATARAHDPRVAFVFGAINYAIIDEAALRFSALAAEETQAQWEANGRVTWLQGLTEDVVADLPYWLARRCVVHGCTTLIPREILHLVGPFDESLPRTSDYEMWNRIHSWGFTALYDPQPCVISQVHAVNTADWPTEVLHETALVQRHYRGLAGPPQLVRGWSKLDDARKAELHGGMGDDFWNNAAYDLALEEYQHARALGSTAYDARIVEAEANVRFTNSAKEPGVTFPAPIVLIPYTKGGSTARMGQVLRLLFEASLNGIPTDVCIWISHPTLQGEVSNCVLDIYRALGEPAGLPPMAIVSGDLSDAMARAQVLIPAGTWADAVPIDLAKRMGVPVLYKLSTPLLKALAMKHAQPFAAHADAAMPESPALDAAPSSAPQTASPRP